MPTLAELNEVTNPLATDQMHVRRNSDVNDPDKRMTLDKIALLGTAQSWTQLQTFNAGLTAGGGATFNAGLVVAGGDVSISPGLLSVSGVAWLNSGINILGRYRSYIGAALTVSTSPVQVYSNAGHSTGALVLVHGSDGGEMFLDLMLVLSYGQIIQISSAGQGAPAARSYSFVGDAQGVNLAMASGTYTVRAACVAGVYHAA